MAETIFADLLIQRRTRAENIIIRIRRELLFAGTDILAVFTVIVRHERDDFLYPVRVRVEHIFLDLRDFFDPLSIFGILFIHSRVLYPRSLAKSTFIDTLDNLATLRSMTPYRFLDHTADLGIEVTGSSLNELFTVIGTVIFELQVKGPLEDRKSVTITCSSDSLEDLFVDWCRELLYNFAVRGFIPNTYNITLHDHSLTAHLRGDVFDTDRHSIKTEIKNVTYHDLCVEQTDTGYRATAVFDV